MIRRRASQLQLVAAGLVVAVAVLMLGLLVVLVHKKNERERREAEWRATQEQQVETEREAEVDPFHGLEQRAIDVVRSRAVGDSDIGRRVESGELRRRVDSLARPGVEEIGWTATRLGEHSVYSVAHLHRFHGVEFGPRWYVQLDSEGPRPEGSEGVVAVNGLAAHLNRSDMDDGIRFLNRGDEVLTALTEHRFQGGTRLGSALLLYFEGRSTVASPTVLGWHVVPEQTDPDEDVIYRAWFLWEQAGATHDAWWEVNLTRRDFRAKDLQANEIMAIGATIANNEVIDIRPRTLDTTQPPSAEPDPRRRALRYVLADDRLIEAVATLLSFRARAADLDYSGWELNVTSDRHVYDVACMFKEGGDERRVTWRVDAGRGVVTPTSEIAETAHRVLALAEQREH